SDKLSLHELIRKNSSITTDDNTNESITKTTSTDENEDGEEEILEKPRIVLQKIQFDDPELFPPELTPDLVKELSQENAQRTNRQRRSNNSTTSLNTSPNKKRHRKVSDE
ncbi:unnamed protein product, partial [Adineta steineri]